MCERNGSGRTRYCVQNRRRLAASERETETESETVQSILSPSLYASKSTRLSYASPME